MSWDGKSPYGRTDTINETLKLLHSIRPKDVNIVEIGGIRKWGAPGISGDGHSTVAWCLYVNKHGGHVWSVDIDHQAQACAAKTLGWLTSVASLVIADGIEFLEDFPVDIDLLYLDAWDVNPKDPAYKQKHLEAFQAAEPKLAKEALVLIDDTNIDHGGKGALIMEYIAHPLKPWRCVFHRGQQTLLQKTQP